MCDNVRVSIVIVCMNNLKNLYPCLDSIKKYTKVSYETFVVAYLFSKENLEKLRNDYPWITIIESNEIRGFSENNNLALRQVKGDFCFVLNDDTLFSCDAIGLLCDTLQSLPNDVAIVSPITLNRDGSIQRNGRPKYTIFTYFLDLMRIIKYYENASKYTGGKGIYQTYNISGAAFLIKTEVFRSLNWFDERYFFCPEDIALSTLINQRGMKCYVNTNISITHLRGETRSKVHTATLPACKKGELIFYAHDIIFKRILFIFMIYIFHSLYGGIWFFKYLLDKKNHYQIMYKVHFNTIKTIGSKLTPKQIFIQYYETIRSKSL